MDNSQIDTFTVAFWLVILCGVIIMGFSGYLLIEMFMLSS